MSIAAAVNCQLLSGRRPNTVEVVAVSQSALLLAAAASVFQHTQKAAEISVTPQSSSQLDFKRGA